MPLNLYEALHATIRTNDPKYCIIGTIQDVNEDDNTCTVVPLDDNKSELLGIDYNPLFIPAVGAQVIVSYLSQNEGYISLFSDVDKLDLKTGEASLHDIMNSILDNQKNICNALIALTVTCAAVGSPSSPPVNLAEFTEYSAKADEITETLNLLLK